MSTNWRIYGKDTVACKLSKADIPGFFRKQVVIGPNEAALIVRNGEVEETITETAEKISGLWDRLKSPFGRGDDIDIILIDTSPFDFTIYLGETQKVSESGEASESASGTLRTQKVKWDPKHPIKTLNKESEILESTEHLKANGNKIKQTKNEVYAALEGYSQARFDTSNVTLLGVTLDHEIVSAECRMRVSVLLDDAKVFSGLLKGRTALANWDLGALIRDELLAKILLPRVAQHRSDELRGNKDLYDQITSDVKSQMLQTFNLWGLTLEDFIINWGLTESELHEINEKRQKREEDAINFSHRRHLAEMQRQLEIEKTRISNLQQLKVAETQGDEELKDLLLASDINRDLMIEGKRVDVAQVDADVQTIQLDVERQEANLRLETQKNEELLRLEIQDREFKQKQQARLAEIEAEDKEMQGMVRMQIQMASAKHDREMESKRLEIDADFRKRQQQAEQQYQERKLRFDEHRERISMQERLISQGLASGAGESGVLKEMLKQQTEQTYADASDAKTEARSQAEAAKHNLETFKQAEDRERDHQKDMTKLSTDMMDASKQTPGSTIVTGGGTATPGQPPSSVNIVNVPGQGETKPGPSADGLKCPNCNGSIQADWKACPNCGQPLTKNSCPKCGKNVEPNWKACPECGEKL